MKAYLLFMMRPIVPFLWMLSLMLAMLFVGLYFLGLGEGMTGRKGADDINLVWAAGFVVAAVPLFTHRDSLPPPDEG